MPDPEAFNPNATADRIMVALATMVAVLIAALFLGTPA